MQLALAAALQLLVVAYHAGSVFLQGQAVPRDWEPALRRLVPAPRGKTSVAQLTEQQALPGASISYVHPTLRSVHVKAQPQRAQNRARVTFGRLYRAAEGDGTRTAWEEAEHKVMSGIKDEAEGLNKDAAEERARQYVSGEDGKRPTKPPKKGQVGKKTGIARCGFSWDDAAVKMGDWCSGMAGSDCVAPPGTTENPESYWYGEEYACYNDLPDLGVRAGGRYCRSTSDATTDKWCTQVRRDRF